MKRVRTGTNNLSEAHDKITVQQPDKKSILDLMGSMKVSGRQNFNLAIEAALEKVVEELQAKAKIVPVMNEHLDEKSEIPQVHDDGALKDD